MKKIRNIILALSILTFSVSLYGCADKESGSSDSKIKLYDNSNSYVNPNDKFSETNPPGETTEGKIGVKTAFKDCEINLKEIITIGKINNSKIGYAAIFEIKNNSKEDMEVSALGDFTVQADEGSIYGGISAEANAIISSERTDLNLMNTTIKAGETFSGYITFQNLTEWKNLKISYIPEYDNDSNDSVVYNITPDMITEQ